MVQIADNYPAHAAKGADYFSGAPRGDIMERHGDEQIIRPEKVVITDVELDYEGRLCVGERTVRHWAQTFGMVDGWRVQNMLALAQADADERDLLSRELAEARDRIETLMDLERQPARVVFVDSEGVRHESAAAAENAGRKAAGLASKSVTGVRPIKPDEAPDPAPKVPAKAKK